MAEDVAREIRARVRAQEEELRVRRGFGADIVAMHPEDVRAVRITALYGLRVYADPELGIGCPGLISEEAAERR